MPRLGAASIVVSINDEEGLVVRHGYDGSILASMPAAECDDETWNTIWKTFEGLGVTRHKS